VKYDFQILDSEKLSDGFLTLHRYRLRHSLFAGGWSEELERERVDGFRAASVLPYDPVTDQLVLIEQFRIGALDGDGSPWILEVVGGILEGEHTPEQVAHKETREEAGCEISELIPICEYMPSPGTTSERVYLFCGRVDASGVDGGIHGVDAEGEDIRVSVVDAEQTIAEMHSGRIHSSSTLIALQWLALNRERLRSDWLKE
jgi:ADP-ribose pyrophosphatase